jgi:hypothetical protein
MLIWLSAFLESLRSRKSFSARRPSSNSISMTLPPSFIQF